MKFFILLYLNLFCIAYSQENVNENEPKNSTENRLEFNLENKESESSFLFLPNIEELFKSPAILSTLDSGAVAINRSVESLMESIFYSMLDKDFVHHLTPSWNIFYGITRKVFSSLEGAYVISDSMYLGPGYAIKLGNIGEIPINFVSKVSGSFLDIYLRTDAERFLENKELPLHQYLLRNWFGILPLMEKILPPSFNANEMFNPLHQLEVPFVFPFTKNGFESMPVGSIRSYNLSGVLSLPFSISEFFANEFKNFLKVVSLPAQLPYTLAIEGDYRINVLRKKSNIAWVGVTRIQTGKHSLAGIFGQTFYVLKNSLNPIPWKGVPANLYPIDFSFEQALVNSYDLLFEYNLTKKIAENAYKQAVLGSFEESYKCAKDPNSGVSFQFEQNKKSKNQQFENSHNVYAINYKNSKKSSNSEIEIKDPNGKYYILENILNISNENWNIMLGKQENSFYAEVILNVTRQKDPKHPKEFIYSFKNLEKPYDVVLTFQIIDQNTNIGEYLEYTQNLKNLFKLENMEFPSLDQWNKDELLKQKQKMYFSSPNKTAFDIHITKTGFGKFNSIGKFYLEPKHLKKLSSINESNFNKCLQEAYDYHFEFGIDNNYFATALTKTLEVLSLPLQIVHLDSNHLNSINEINEFKKNIIVFKTIKTPMEHLEAFSNLLNIRNPRSFTLGISCLLGIENLAREVSVFVKPNKNLPSFETKLIEHLDGATFSSVKKPEILKRYSIAKEKAEAFYPAKIRDWQKKPSIYKIDVFKFLNIISSETALILEIHIKEINPLEPTKFYFKIEQGGKLELGKLVLAQDALTLDSKFIDKQKSSLQETVFKIPMFNKETPFNSYLLSDSEFPKDAKLVIHLAAAQNQNNWSNQQKIEINIENGLLIY